MNCNSNYCIYCITSTCGKKYLGECTHFRARTNLHKNQIAKKCYRVLPVSKHIHECGGKFTIAPIYLMRDSSLINRQVRENYFIEKYQTESNKSISGNKKYQKT